MPEKDVQDIRNRFGNIVAIQIATIAEQIECHEKAIKEHEIEISKLQERQRYVLHSFNELYEKHFPEQIKIRKL